MKNQILAIVMLLLVSQVVSAQKKHTVKLSSADKKISFQVENSDIKVETHSANELLIETDDEYEVPERAKGLQPLYNGAKDNTGMALNVSKSDGEVMIKKASNRSMSYTVKIPKSMNVYMFQKGWRSSTITVKDVAGEIEIKATSSDIKLENVGGPLVLNNTNGDIEIIMSNTLSSNPSAISSINGEVDITVPATMKADLNLSSLNGDVFTDMDIKLPETKGDMKKVGGRGTKGTVNGGGLDFSVRNINGNIYLRKK